jgi:phosphoribosyl 1,2-cyclic phosphodiesterase
MAVFVKFWGTRGSIPTPATWTRVYGGNTPCVEVRIGETVLICDAGSGIRGLGKDLLSRQSRPAELHLLLTHTHWDHIQGFPLFAPAFMKATRIVVYERAPGDHRLFELLSGQMSSEYFPVPFRELGAEIAPDFFIDNCKSLNKARIRSFPLNHPGGCRGFVIEAEGRKIVYATDNELDIPEGQEFRGNEKTAPLRPPPPALLEVARNADLLITDAQYNEPEYAAKRGWGHSSCFSVIDWAIAANAASVALFHHDPESSDTELDERVNQCAERAALHGAQLSVFAAREGVELKF